MSNNFPFTFKNLKDYYQVAINVGYEVMSCYNYTKRKNRLSELTLVNRVDIDCSMEKAEIICDLFNELEITGTFFVRLHAKEYNPFSFENYRILKYIKQSGHEIGYHSEVIDEAKIWKENPDKCLKRDILILEKMLDLKIHGVASHGGLTGFNNLDFWKKTSPLKFGLKYEAYDNEKDFDLFNNSFYISDSEWVRWKCYKNGILQINDNRTPDHHFEIKHSKIYLLIHPETYYERHIYE